ncbi:2'-5' RNA ligase family protein [Pseudonocardia sp.]|uniref:2'-5' RNA ligase family protein n=1 Tax=Pseudonocardia sp. TaxID=60912 RepID=UPI003D121706
MAHVIRFRLDDAACARLVALRERAATATAACTADGASDGAAVRAGGRSDAGWPAVVVAAATAVPPPARAALAAELRLLRLPSLWLATLGAPAGRPDHLVLAAVVDTEVLAVHAAVHDALAGRVRGPVAEHLPGSWLPHCVLAIGDAATTAAAFARLHPVEAVRARVTGVEVHDTVTGATEPI